MLIKVTPSSAESPASRIDRGWKTIDVVTHTVSGRLNLLIPPGLQKDDPVSEEKPRDGLMFVLFWRSHDRYPGQCFRDHLSIKGGR